MPGLGRPVVQWLAIAYLWFSGSREQTRFKSVMRSPASPAARRMGGLSYLEEAVGGYASPADSFDSLDVIEVPVV